MKGAIVLLSGGLDSAVNLALAAQKFDSVKVVTFAYGQRAWGQEKIATAALCHHFQIVQKVIKLDWLQELDQSALTKTDKNLPCPNSSDLDDLKTCLDSAKSVWVPNRNGVFINVAAAIAESQNYNTIVTGFNREEARTFPDNSQEFLVASTQALAFSTANHIQVNSFTANQTKQEIVKTGIDLSLPWQSVWSCYESGPKRCWRCESCSRFERALKANGAEGLKILEGIRNHEF